MEILFLGTGAADYNPDLRTVLKDRFDRTKRRSSSVLLDDEVLIDCGEFILDSIRIAGVDCARIKNVLISHSHSDHFNPAHLSKIAAAAGHPIGVWANGVILDGLARYGCGLIGEDAKGFALLVPHKTVAHTEITFGEWKVMPLRSNHIYDGDNIAPTEESQFFLVEKQGRKLFYGTDGAWMPTDTGKYLYGQQLNGCLFDATCGDYVVDYRIYEHNTLPMVRMMKTVMQEQGCFAPDAKLYLFHIAHSLHKPYEETVEIAARDGLLVPYDGMRDTV